MAVERMYEWGAKSSVIRETFTYGCRRKEEIGADKVFDFSLGNPSVPAPAVVTQALLRQLQEIPPEQLHAYTPAAGLPAVREAIAAYLRTRFDAPAEAGLIYLTAGAAASLTVTLTALLEPGDAVAVPIPFFPEYRVFTERTGAVLTPFCCRAGDFQIDRGALEAVLTPKTRAVIINSPNNPTGAVLTEESVRCLAEVLTEKSAAFGHPIWLVADEPYRELVYGDVTVPWLPSYYPDTMVCYSFSKSLSLPGERIGYVMVSPTAKKAQETFLALCGAGRSLGFVCAPSLFQSILPECLGKTADREVYRVNRDILYRGLTEMGFEVVKPDGAFYLFVKTPEPDAEAFCRRARQWELLPVPSDDFGCGGYVRIAYCVTTEQCERSLPAFRKLAESYGLTGKE